MNNPDLAIIILAAGQSTRMKSKISKMLHPVCGRPIIRYVVDLVEALKAQRAVMVVGYQAERIQRECSGKQIEFVYQKEQLGTAHAVLQAKNFLSGFPGTVLIMNGDVPLLALDEINKLIDFHHNCSGAATILSSDIPDPFGYGRIVRDANGSVTGIVEEKDASAEQREIKEINSGTYCFNSGYLYETLNLVGNRNAKKEYYLTDVIALLRQQGALVHALKAPDFRAVLGINTRMDLAEANRIMRERILKGLMLEGVTIVDPHNAYIDFGVTIGQDTVIGPGVVIEGKSCIGQGCYIGAFCRIINSRLDDSVYVEGACLISGSHLPHGAKILASRQRSQKKSREDF